MSRKSTILAGALIALGVLTLLFAAACGSNSPSDTSSGGTTGQAGNCLDRCTAKLEACGVIAAQAGDACTNQICNNSPTDGQLACLESTDCQTLTSSTQVCGIGSGGTTTSGTTTSGTTTSGTTTSGTTTSGTTTSGTTTSGTTGMMCTAIGQPCMTLTECCGTGSATTCTTKLGASQMTCCVTTSNSCSSDADCCAGSCGPSQTCCYGSSFSCTAGTASTCCSGVCGGNGLCSP
jgi:hypothetical protein